MKNLLHPTGEVKEALAGVAQEHLDDDRAEHLLAAHTWSCLVEPGDGVAGRIVGALGYQQALGEVASGSGAAAREAASIGEREWQDALARWRPRMQPDRMRHALQLACRAGVSLLTRQDAAWPEALSDLGDHTPLVLWVRGDASALTRGALSVALVGARAATGYGEHVAMELSADLVSRGATIVSGAAYGIDGAAHRAALSAGGTTIALLAGGADRPYPAGHADLIGRIARSGAVVSEVPCGSDPTKWRFLQRNRLIAALAQATVVVEAGWRSGTINTAGHAASLARPLGAVPGPITSAASAGCHRILREYDARCITNADEVLELAGALAPTLFDMPEATMDGDRTDDVTRVRDGMSYRSWRHPDEIGRRAGIAAADVTAILGLLALEGAVERGDGGWRRVRPATGVR
jgi:DNA processing protein